MADEGKASRPGGDQAPWARLAKQTLFTTPYTWRLSHDRYRLPSGAVRSYYYLDVAGSVMVVPIADDGRLLFVQQFRYLLSRESLELPAGGLLRDVRGVAADEAVLAGAARELAEETGFTADSLQEIGTLAPYNGVSNGFRHVVVARGLREIGARPEETEAITVVPLSLGEVHARADDGRLWDGMTLAALYLFERWRATLDA